MSYNKSYIHDLSFEELEDFSPNLKGWRQYFFIGVSMIVIALAIIVQKAVYNFLKNNPRAINQIIYPCQVRIFYRVFELNLPQIKRLLGHQKCTFKS